MLCDYKTVLKEASDEFYEKKSRFIGFCKPINNEKEALDFINEKRSKYWNATHNVFAYSLKEGNICRFSDDGEPSQTAGLPTLEVITKSGITNICVVVTRYFGGILLGTGGLVRAYSNGCKIALQAAKPIIMVSSCVCELRCTYNQYGKINALLTANNAKIDDTLYEADVIVKYHIKRSEFESLNKLLADASSGTVKGIVKDEKYFAQNIEKD